MKSKNDKRKELWSKRICITKDSYEYIQEIQEKKEYKTMAGTLDMIINKYKKKV